MTGLPEAMGLKMDAHNQLPVMMACMVGPFQHGGLVPKANPPSVQCGKGSTPQCTAPACKGGEEMVKGVSGAVAVGMSGVAGVVAWCTPQPLLTPPVPFAAFCHGHDETLTLMRF